MPTSSPSRRSGVRERRLAFNAPVRAWALAEWALVPLRLFLGATFLFAGVQKLSSTSFFNDSAPNSIKAQMLGAVRTSPIHSIVSHLINFANPIGEVIAYSEVLIGVAVLLGLWTRAAAIGAALLSFSLFLTVSFHASPYFTGADIVFFFAWMPFIVAGGGTRLSLDAKIANAAARRGGAPPPELVPIAFSKVQELCGNFSDNTCRARAGLACDAGLCPVLLGDHAPVATRVAIDPIDRRALVLGASAAALIGATTIAAAAATGEIVKLIGGDKASASTSTNLNGPTTTTPGATGGASGGSSTSQGTLLGPAKDVSVGNPATFTVPSSGDPGIVLELATSDYVAYDTVCPHMGCVVGFSPSANLLVCPCHGSQFQVTNGDVLGGPAPHGLTKLDVVAGPDGNLYLK